MTKQRQTTGNRLASSRLRPAAKKLPALRFPIQREIHKLQDALDAFNEQIAELQSEGHSGSCHESVENKRAGFRTSDRRTSQPIN